MESRRSTDEIVDHFFRHESAKVIAHLSRHFGPAKLEMIEDAVQEGLIKAMQTWPYRGIPNNPSGWILTVARNRMVDLLRRERKMLLKEDEDLLKGSEDLLITEQLTPDELEGHLKDDLLRMIFACCHPELSIEAQIILTLRILCGLGNAEVARALLKKDDAVAKAYTRAKAKMRDHVGVLELPAGSASEKRLSVVLKVIYLLFNEGYKCATGDELLKKDLCEEAIRLNQLLLDSEVGNRPTTNALMALMYFHTARFASRTGPDGELLTLQNQDRNLWDQDMINRGEHFLQIAFRSSVISEYHVQAGIAAIHCHAQEYSATNWDGILELYDLQMEIRPSPVVALNRVVAYSQRHGSEAALDELDQMENKEFLADYYLYYAIRGNLMEEIARYDEARTNLEKAIALVQNQLEKRYLEQKLQAVEAKKLKLTS